MKDEREKTGFEAWELFPKIDGPLQGAGPCSAESEAQVLETARALAGRIAFFRAGIWKPRTRPGGFEGVGARGLPWLVRARAETGVKIGSEVANPAHVEAVLEHGLDLLWIGARTVTNPFSVQELADVLRGVDIPVLVKNPMSADAGLWTGAVERLAGAGLRRIGLIHRGVPSASETRFRNAPSWSLAGEMRRRMPELPMLCDPSHIAGRAELVPAVAQEAMDMLFDGLMTEVHPDPSVALSDAAQQLTPAAFFEMVSGLHVPAEHVDSDEFDRRLAALRREVDELDGRVLELLGERMGRVEEMGRLKAERNVATLQPDRWSKVVEDRMQRGRRQALSEPFVARLMEAIHEEALRRQEARRETENPRRVP